MSFDSDSGGLQYFESFLNEPSHMDFFSTEALVALITLTSLEVVLGIDNIVFIAVLAGKLPDDQRDSARKLGLAVAVISRAVLVLSISFVMQLNQPLLTVGDIRFSGKDLILIFGGLFLLGKATSEIRRRVERGKDPETSDAGFLTLKAVLTQVLIVDVVFSLDSVITAVGMTEGLQHPIPVMVTAIVISVVVMLAFSRAIISFIEQHPALKILALSFLLLIGTLLVAEGFHQPFPKGYVYFAMAFSLGVELLQMKSMQPHNPAAQKAD